VDLSGIAPDHGKHWRVKEIAQNPKAKDVTIILGRSNDIGDNKL
jgi:hypothetical protein